MNKVILLGNLCRDIEVRYTQNEIMVIQNTIAVRNNYKNQDGEYDSQFINIVVWSKTAEYLSKYASKGSRVLLEGRLNTRTYEKDGQKRYITEVYVGNIQIIGNTKKDETSTKENENETQKEERDPFEEFGEIVEMDEDLPF